MSAWTLNVYVSRPAAQRAQAWCAEIERLQSVVQLHTRVVEASAFCVEALDTADAHALWWNPATPDVIVNEFSDLCEEHLRPAIILTDGQCPTFAFSATIVQPIEQPADLAAARLHGLLMRQADVRRLQNELAISTRCTGGLRGEITRMHDELQLAAMVQQEFLPRELPDVHGVRFAALWQPASYVSGDIYDVARLDDEHVGLFLADAVGHGVPAALLTMVICRSLPTREVVAGRTRIVPPSEALSRLNAEMIRRQGRTTRFATAVYGILNCRTRVLQLAGAGHPSPMIFHPDGRNHSLETPGGLLGVFSDESFDQIEIELGLDDRLVMYSDGFELAFPNARGSASQPRLPSRRYLDEFDRLRAETDTKRAIESIRDSVGRQLGSLHQIDDLTMICVDAGAPVASAESAKCAVAEDAAATSV